MQADVGGEGHRGEGEGARAGQRGPRTPEGGKGSRGPKGTAEGVGGKWRQWEGEGAGHGRQSTHVAEWGAEGGRVGGEAQGGRARGDEGRRGCREQEARDRGRWEEVGMWGRPSTMGRGPAGGEGVPSHRSPRRQVLPVYPPPTLYPCARPPAPVLPRPRAVQAARVVPGGKGEELWSAWERVVEEEMTLREREARVIGSAAGAAGAEAHAQGAPRLGEAQAIGELQRAWTDVRRRKERVEREERYREQQEVRSKGGQRDRGPPPAAAVQADGYPPGGGTGTARARLGQDQG